MYMPHLRGRLKSRDQDNDKKGKREGERLKEWREMDGGREDLEYAVEERERGIDLKIQE